MLGTTFVTLGLCGALAAILLAVTFLLSYSVDRLGGRLDDAGRRLDALSAWRENDRDRADALDAALKELAARHEVARRSASDHCAALYDACAMIETRVGALQVQAFADRPRLGLVVDLVGRLEAYQRVLDRLAGRLSDCEAHDRLTCEHADELDARFRALASDVSAACGVASLPAPDARGGYSYATAPTVTLTGTAVPADGVARSAGFGPNAGGTGPNTAPRRDP